MPVPRLSSERLPAAVGRGGGRRPVANQLADPAARSADLGLPVGLTLPRSGVNSVWRCGAATSRRQLVAAARRPRGEGTDEDRLASEPGAIRLGGQRLPVAPTA